MTVETYPRLLAPTELGPLSLRNHVFISAHTTNFAQDFLPTQQHVDYHRARAAGGVGLIITEGIRVHPSSVGRSNCLVGYDPRALDGFRSIANAVHEEGAKIVGQLVHTGRHNDNVMTGSVAWAPSPRRWDATGLIPHPMTRRDIADLVAHYVLAARLMMDAGFDGVEIHLGHGHLLHQFLSPKSNLRVDDYGGTLQNRARLAVEILKAIDSCVSDAFAIGVRISADDFAPDGLHLEDSLAVTAHLLAAAPRIDFIDVTHAEYTTPSAGYHVADMTYGDAPFTRLPAAYVERFPATPILAICRVTSLDIAETVLKETGVRLVGMTRAHIADAAIIRKAQEGRLGEIRPCVSCNFCVGQLNRGLPITCMMNPTVGKEADWSDSYYSRAPEPKHVIVVGAGPAGLEAARVAGEHGHRVEVWEASGEPGGRLRIAKNGRGRSDLAKLVDYELTQLRRLGIAIHRGKEATRELLVDAMPDVIVVGSGAEEHCHDSLDLDAYVSPEQAIEQQIADVRTVLYDADGSWASASVAETLAGNGCEVTVVSAAPTAFWLINSYSQMLILDRLREQGVRFRYQRRLQSWRDGEVVVSDPDGGTESLRDVEILCLAEPGAPRIGLLEDMPPTVEVVVVGDALAPRDLLQVMHQGHQAGRSL